MNLATRGPGASCTVLLRVPPRYGLHPGNELQKPFLRSKAFHQTVSWKSLPRSFPDPASQKEWSSRLGQDHEAKEVFRNRNETTMRSWPTHNCREASRNLLQRVTLAARFGSEPSDFCESIPLFMPCLRLLLLLGLSHSLAPWGRVQRLAPSFCLAASRNGCASMASPGCPEALPS